MQNTTHFYATAGSFHLSLVVSSLEQCADTAYRTVIVHPLPSTDIRDTILCLNSSIQFNATGADSYQWSPNYNLSCDTCHNPIVSPLVDTFYFVDAKTSLLAKELIQYILRWYIL